jgi:hypothetical protein
MKLLRLFCLGVLGTLLLGMLVIFAYNAAGGCYPWSPKDVAFHQGMTLCPGQTAHGTIKLPDTTELKHGR